MLISKTIRLLNKFSQYIGFASKLGYILFLPFVYKKNHVPHKYDKRYQDKEKYSIIFNLKLILIVPIITLFTVFIVRVDCGRIRWRTLANIRKLKIIRVYFSIKFCIIVIVCQSQTSSSFRYIRS